MKLSFEKSIWICAPPAAVFAHLSEPRNFVGLQPLLVELRETGRGSDPEGRPTRRFETVEKLRLAGFLPFRNRIEGLLTLVSDDEAIEIMVWSWPRLVLRSHYRLCHEAGGTRVAEGVAIDCPGLLAWPVRRQAERAHDHLLCRPERAARADRRIGRSSDSSFLRGRSPSPPGRGGGMRRGVGTRHPERRAGLGEIRPPLAQASICGLKRATARAG
ncbi:MAG TPA: SRPBCC family protein [Myxococcota bacterium]|nr:SRPBCC family protein [Myxococcota bacterium]